MINIRPHNYLSLLGTFGCSIALVIHVKQFKHSTNHLKYSEIITTLSHNSNLGNGYGSLYKTLGQIICGNAYREQILQKISVARLLLRDLHGLLSWKGSRVIKKMAHISEEFNTNDYGAISYIHASVLTDLAHVYLIKNPPADTWLL